MAQEPLRGGGLALATVALSLGVFMNVLDLSIANVSIPYIAGDLGVSVDQGTWVITSFAVTTAIGMPLTGWLAARFGEMRVFSLCTVLFALVSFLCGLSTNMTELIALRALQGAVAGPMIPLSQSILLSSYPAQKRGLALGIWSTIAVVGPVCGPILGGWLTDNYSWPWIFYINVPLGLASAAVTWRLLRSRETAIVRRPIDAVGIGLLAIGLGCLQVLLDRGEDLDWFGSPVIVALAVASVVALSYLVVWELTAANPVPAPAGARTAQITGAASRSVPSGPSGLIAHSKLPSIRFSHEADDPVRPALAQAAKLRRYGAPENPRNSSSLEPGLAWLTADRPRAHFPNGENGGLFFLGSTSVRRILYLDLHDLKRAPQKAHDSRARHGNSFVHVPAMQ